MATSTDLHLQDRTVGENYDIFDHRYFGLGHPFDH